MPITEQQLLQIAKAKGIDTSKYEQKTQPPQSGVGGIMKRFAPGILNAANVAFGGKNQLDQTDQLNTQYKQAQIAALTAKANAPQQGYFNGIDEQGNAIPIGNTNGMKPAPQIYTPQGSQNIQSRTDLNNSTSEAMSQPPPAGLVKAGGKFVQDPTYIDPVEKSKLDEAEAKKQADIKQQSDLQDSVRSSAQENLNAITEAKKGKEFFGPFGDWESRYAPNSFLGGGKYDQRSVWESNVNNLLSKKVVDLIGQMKSLSKTGATGFGNLSDQEGQLLQQASTVFNKKLPPEQAVHYLNEMEKIYQHILGGASQQSEQQVGGRPHPSTLSDEELTAIAGSRG